MKCPDRSQWDLLATDVLESEQAERLLEHARNCATCRQRYQEARRAHTDRLRMYEALDRDHDILREQLMAALPEEPPQSASTGAVRRLGRGLGGLVMKANTRAGRVAAAVLAPAACILIAVGILFSPSQQSAFAQALERLREASTIVGRVQSFLNDSEEPLQTGSMYISSEFGSRFDSAAPGAEEAQMTVFTRPEGLIVMVAPALGGVVRMHMPEDEPTDAFDWDWQQRSPGAFIRGFTKLVGEADRDLGVALIEGRQARGFEVSGQRLGLAFPGSASAPTADQALPESAARLWVDVRTNLPVRMEVDIYQRGGVIGDMHILAIYDQFQWDVPLDPEFFEPQIPEDAQIIDVYAPPLSEQTLVDALRLYSDAFGYYPPVLDAARVTAEYAVNMAMQGKVQFDPENPFGSFSGGVMQDAITLGRGVVFCQRLARADREPEYFGEIVTPEDVDEVLLRWRREDGSYRVIYGDLRIETVESPD